MSKNPRKHFWTLPSAAKELGMCMRHLRRYAEALGLKPWQPERRGNPIGGQQRIFVFTPREMQQLKEAIERRICLP